MGTTTKILQSLGNYHDGILTTTMRWTRTGHESFPSKCSDMFFGLGTFIEGLFIIFIIKLYQIPFNLTDMG